MAKGLIPLMLASSTNNRYSCPPPARTPDLRRQSTPNAISLQNQSPRPRQPKRFSLPTPAPLPMVPYSSADWKKAIAEIKRMHFGKRYRACSVRCVEILESIKDRSQVEPIYLIYLHFYAATSMEMCARPLPSNSPLRTHFFEQARSHFDRAATLISAAEESVISKARSGSVASSRSSSCHSPSGSISSCRSWTPVTRMSSPTESICSFDEFSSRLNSPKRVKKVSFSLPKDETIQIPEPIHFSEPFIRPDSPTLGIDEYFQAGIAKQELPELPVPPSPLKFQEVEWALHTIPECDDEDLVSEEDDESAYIIARSVDRCCEHLSGLRTQLVRHAANLDESLSPRSASAQESYFMDKQTRIERLRKIGWQRKRFNARRYEELCEAVLAELS